MGTSAIERTLSGRAGTAAVTTRGAERLAAATQVMARQAARWDQRLATIKRIAEAIHRQSTIQARPDRAQAAQTDVW
jgi:hypothetical protein